MWSFVKSQPVFLFIALFRLFLLSSPLARSLAQHVLIFIDSNRRCVRRFFSTRLFFIFFFVNLFCHTQFAWLSNCVRIEPITMYAHKNGPAKYDGLIGSMALILLLFSFQMFNASHFSHCLDFYCIFHLKQILLPIHIQRLKHKK